MVLVVGGKLAQDPQMEISECDSAQKKRDRDGRAFV